MINPEDLIECPDCKKLFDKWSQNWNDFYNVCQKCSYSYMTCELCREPYLAIDGYYIDETDICLNCVQSGRDDLAYCDVCKEYHFMDWAKDYYKQNPNDYKVCPECESPVLVCDSCNTYITKNHSGYDHEVSCLCKSCYVNTVLVNQLCLSFVE